MPHVILVGSWAEFAYHEAGLLDGFNPNITTLDVDFLVRNLRRPSPAASLAALARERGFLVESDVLNGTTKLFDTSGLEVEFLIGKRGAGIEPALRTNVGVTAQALRHMEILSGSSVEVRCWGASLTFRFRKPIRYIRWPSTLSVAASPRKTPKRFWEYGRFSMKRSSGRFSPSSRKRSGRERGSSWTCTD